MKKEAILICLYAYFPFENANTNVMLPLIKRLASTYEVHILTENRDNSALKYEISNSGIIIHRYRRLGKLARNLQNLANLDKKKKRNLSKKFFILPRTTSQLEAFGFTELGFFALLRAGRSI